MQGLALSPHPAALTTECPDAVSRAASGLLGEVNVIRFLSCFRSSGWRPPTKMNQHPLLKPECSANESSSESATARVLRTSGSRGARRALGEEFRKDSISMPDYSPGTITCERTFVVICWNCGEEDFAPPDRTFAESTFRRRGWSKTVERGWACGACKENDQEDEHGNKRLV